MAAAPLDRNRNSVRLTPRIAAARSGRALRGLLRRPRFFVEHAATRRESDTDGLQEFEELGLVALVTRIIASGEEEVADLAHPSGARHVTLYRLAGALGPGVGVDAENSPGNVVLRHALIVRFKQANVGVEVPVVIFGQAPATSGVLSSVSMCAGTVPRAALASTSSPSAPFAAQAHLVPG